MHVKLDLVDPQTMMSIRSLSYIESIWKAKKTYIMKNVGYCRHSKSYLPRPRANSKQTGVKLPDLQWALANWRWVLDDWKVSDNKSRTFSRTCGSGWLTNSNIPLLHGLKAHFGKNTYQNAKTLLFFTDLTIFKLVHIGLIIFIRAEVICLLLQSNFLSVLF